MERHILVAGSPRWPYEQTVSALLDLHALAGMPVADVLVVVHGAGPGVAHRAHQWVYAQRARWVLSPQTHPEVREFIIPRPAMVSDHPHPLELALVLVWNNDPEALAAVRAVRAAGINAVVMDMHPPSDRSRRQRGSAAAAPCA